jgi:cytochrome c biogenesis protein CcmG/thiol:disulfide interchange protein DsbE
MGESMRAKYPILAAAFCALLSLSVAANADPAVGDDAPALSGPVLGGKAFDLSALKGKVAIIHFWATWCAPCRVEMPSLEAVWRQYHSKGVEVLAVSADRPRAKGDVTQVMQYFTFPAAMMSDLSKNDFGTPGAIPVTYVIGKDGKIADILTPDSEPLTSTGLGDKVKALLDPKLASPAKDSDKTDAKP